MYMVMYRKIKIKNDSSGKWKIRVSATKTVFSGVARIRMYVICKRSDGENAGWGEKQNLSSSGHLSRRLLCFCVWLCRPFQGRSSWGRLKHPRYFNSCGRREQKRDRDNQLQQLETKKMPQKVFQRYFLCCRLHLEKRAISNLCWFFYAREPGKKFRPSK